METPDFHSLPRRELQALCKKHKIPANLTNVAMADALIVLYAEGAPGEDLAAAQELKTSTNASHTTTARQNASMSKTGRSSRRGAAKGEERKEIDGIPLIELPDTPVLPSGRKTRAREAMKTPGRSEVDATVGAKIHEEEKEEATALHSKRASVRSMRSRKKVSFALGEDGEGERGFGIEAKKTPVAPRIRGEEEAELGRRGMSRSATARGMSQRRSGRLMAVPKMADFSATEERDEEEEVPISDKQEIVVAEEETSDSVITYEADEGMQSSQWIGSEEIPEDVNPTADVVEAVVVEEGDDQLTAGDVTAGEEEAFEVLHAEGGDLTVSSAGALASENVSDSSPEVSEAVVGAVGSVIVDADEPAEDAVDEVVRGLDGTATVAEEDVMVDVSEVQEVDEGVKSSEWIGSEEIPEGANPTADTVEPVAEEKTDDQLTPGDVTAGEEEASEFHHGDSEGGDLVSSAGALASENVSDSSPEVSEAVVGTVGSVIVGADVTVEDVVDEAIVRGLDGTAAVDEEDVIMDMPEVQEVELLADDIYHHVAEVIEEDVESSDDANCVAGDDNGATANGEMLEDLDEFAGDGDAGCDKAVDTDEVIVGGEAHEDVATLPMVVAHPVIEAADCGEVVDELMEILDDMPKTEEHTEAGCDNAGDVDEVMEDGEGQEDVIEKLAAESLPEAGCDNGDELPVNGEEQENVPEDEVNNPLPEDAHPVIEATDHDEEGGEGNGEQMEVAEEDMPADNSGSNELPTEAVDEGKIPVEYTDDVVVFDVTPIAETEGEITVTVSANEFTVENYSVTEETASCDNPSMAVLDTVACDAMVELVACDVYAIVETALCDVEQIVEAVGSDGSPGNAPVEETSFPEESPENPEVGNVELQHDELVTEEEIIPSHTEHVMEASELNQVPVQCGDDVATLLASCIVAETPEAPMGDVPNVTTGEHICIPMATPIEFAAVEISCSAKRSALSKKQAGVSDKENTVAILYSSSKQPVVENGTENNMKKKNGLPTPAELEKMSLRQLRKQLEALSVHDSYKRHEDEMVLMSGKKPERKRTALATLQDNCLMSPQPGRY